MAVSLFYTQQKKPRRVCRPQAAKIEIIFSRDMCVRENTSQAASVEFVRQRHTNYARSRLQDLSNENPAKRTASLLSEKPTGFFGSFKRDTAAAVSLFFLYP